MTTDAQKKAVAFIEKWLKIKYTGNLECYGTVSYFIGKYLNKAKEASHQYMLDKLFSDCPIEEQY